MEISNFNIFSTVIFILAVIHAFITPYFLTISKKYQSLSEQAPSIRNKLRSLSELFYLLGEVELVFGIWLLPLIAGLIWIMGLEKTITFLENRDYTYAIYMTVVVVIISTKPIIYFAESCIGKIAGIWKNTPAAWWWTILTLGPLLVPLLKEPGAMAISSILFAKTCFPQLKKPFLRYSSVALLFLNISLGGLISPYTSRFLFFVAFNRHWSFDYAFFRFGWKALLIIGLNNFLYYYIFRRYIGDNSEKITQRLQHEKKNKPPVWLIATHLIFFFVTVISSTSPAIFLGFFFLFLGFHKATHFFQGEKAGTLYLKPAIFIGFFFASLLIHGEFQRWWSILFLENIDFEKGFILTYLLSALIDNAVVVFFLEQIPSLSEEVLYAVISGSLSSAGLTLMANAPNLIAYTTLKKHFSEELSLIALFIAGIPISLVSLLIFWIFS